MSMEILRDPRIRTVEWHDLVRVSRLATLRELSLSIPWLAASLVLAHHRLYVLAAPCSFMFYLAGLRQVHNAFHNALGLSRSADRWITREWRWEARRR
jgi:hypothetical protein